MLQRYRQVYRPSESRSNKFFDGTETYAGRVGTPWTTDSSRFGARRRRRRGTEYHAAGASARERRCSNTATVAASTLEQRPDRQTDKQTDTPDRCFTLTVFDAASQRNNALVLTCTD